MRALAVLIALLAAATGAAAQSDPPPVAVAADPPPMVRVGGPAPAIPKTLPAGRDNAGKRFPAPAADNARQTPRSPYCGCDDGCKCAPGCECGLPAAATAEDPYRNPLWFALHMQCGDRSACSGTPIYSDGTRTVVLTNAHFAHPGRDRFGYTVTVPNGRTYPATRVVSSNVRDTGPGTIAIDGPDLAFLVVDANLGMVPIASDDPAAGEPVAHWGYGHSYGVPMVNGPQPKRKDGVVRGMVRGDVASTIAASSGDSGAGVFNARGELVAVTHGGSPGEGITHLAAPITLVRAYAAGRPVLARLFPRLADRLDAKREAREAAPKGQPSAPVDPAALAVPGQMPACPNGACPTAPQADARRWQVNGRGSYTTDDIRAMGFRLPGDPATCPGGVCRPQAPAFAFPGNCPNGRCPLQR